MTAPPYGLHGELTADGTRIVLVASGDVEAASKRLPLLTPLIRPTDPPGGLHLPLTWAAVVQLSYAYGPAWRPGPALSRWITEEMWRRLAASAHPLALAYQPPKGLKPRPYQVEGANLIANVGSVLITDEPGTGKTITAILGLLEREANTWGTVAPVVVVCPASVVDPWVAAWREWAPHVRAVAWRGTPKQRVALAGTADVYVTSYDTAIRDAADTNPRTSPLVALEPRSLVIDECHLIKNMHAARSHATRRLAKHADTVIALSGTPITHHPGDLWPTLVALEPHAWPSRERWVSRYCQTITGDYGVTVLGLEPAREPEFRATLIGQHRRVAKADVLSQLPPKVYSTRVVELPAEWRRAYDDMENQMLAELPSGAELSVMSVLAQLTRLSQLSSAATDVTVTEEPDAEGEMREHVKVTLKAPSWKVDALLEILAERPGQPVVCFAPSRQLTMLAAEQAMAAGYRVGTIVGGQSMRDRSVEIDTFQAGETDLLCATTGAGGVGLTLTAAGTVVFLQRPWSLVEALQAEDRCHRIGSERHTCIEVIDVIAANTIDTRVRAVLRGKAQQLSDLVQDPRIVAELLGGAEVHQLKRKAS